MTREDKSIIQIYVMIKEASTIGHVFDYNLQYEIDLYRRSADRPRLCPQIWHRPLASLEDLLLLDHAYTLLTQSPTTSTPSWCDLIPSPSMISA